MYNNFPDATHWLKKMGCQLPSPVCINTYWHPRKQNNKKTPTFPIYIIIFQMQLIGKKEGVSVAQSCLH